MNSSDAKKIAGFTCSPADSRLKDYMDEKCTLSGTNKEFSTFVGEPIQKVTFSIKSNEVVSIGINTSDPPTKGLENKLIRLFGKPSKRRNVGDNGSAARWNGKAEYISLIIIHMSLEFGHFL